MKEVVGNVFGVVPEQAIDCKSLRRAWAGRRAAESRWLWRSAGDRMPSAAKFQLFQPLDGFALIGDDLRLPDEGNGHEAHGDDAEDEEEADIGLLSGKPKYTPKPSHGRVLLVPSPPKDLRKKRIRFGRFGETSRCL